jgi:transposase
MQRGKFSREFKLEAVRLVKDRGVAVAQAARDLDLHENVLRKWVRDLSGDPQHAFLGHGQMKPEQLEIDRLRKEVAKLKAERGDRGRAQHDRTRSCGIAKRKCPVRRDAFADRGAIASRRPRLSLGFWRRSRSWCSRRSVGIPRRSCCGSAEASIILCALWLSVASLRAGNW